MSSPGINWVALGLGSGATLVELGAFLWILAYVEGGVLKSALFGEEPTLEEQVEGSVVDPPRRTRLVKSRPMGKSGVYIPIAQRGKIYGR